MPEIIIDADACPRSCLSIAQKLGREMGYEVVTVASTAHLIQSRVHVEVDSEPGAADLAVANRARAGDVVVTADWGLAALVLPRGVRAISPRGQVFRQGTMDFLLEERHMKAAFRRGGGRTKGPPPRASCDDRRFAETLRRLLAGEDL